jgi:syntaxin of plants SYP6
MYLNLLHGSSQFMHEHIQVGTVKRAIEKGKSNAATSKYQDTSRTNHYSAQDNDDFLSSESDRQLLLMR